jgi:hypothetical protein
VKPALNLRLVLPANASHGYTVSPVAAGSVHVDSWSKQWTPRWFGNRSLSPTISSVSPASSYRFETQQFAVRLEPGTSLDVPLSILAEDGGGFVLPIETPHRRIRGRFRVQVSGSNLLYAYRLTQGTYQLTLSYLPLCDAIDAAHPIPQSIVSNTVTFTLE